MICPDIAARKSALRLEIKTRRAALCEAQRIRAESALGERVTAFLSTRNERIIGVYLARAPEICLDFLIADLLRKNYQIAAPRLDLSRGEMDFWALKSLEGTEIGPWNVRQPTASQKMKEIPILLVPGLAFDEAGARLGMGGGWYDRTLQEVQVVIGVCFDFQIVARVPTESHDLRVDFVASEKRWTATENLR